MSCLRAIVSQRRDTPSERKRERERDAKGFPCHSSTRLARVNKTVVAFITPLTDRGLPLSLPDLGNKMRRLSANRIARE